MILEDRVVVVGNGPSAIVKEMGNFIDASRHVVRFNNFTTQGYEKFVGSRTTIWAHSASRVAPRDVRQFEEVIYCPSHHPIVEGRSVAWNEVGRLAKEAGIQATIISENTHRALQQWLNRCPSSGVMVVQQLIDTRRFPLPIYIVGFDHWQTPQEHYWGVQTIWQGVHGGSGERMFIEEMQNQGLVFPL